MRVLDLFDNLYIIQLNIEVLIHALQRASDLYVVLELDRHLVVNERLEETIPCPKLALHPSYFSPTLPLPLFFSRLPPPASRFANNSRDEAREAALTPKYETGIR